MHFICLPITRSLARHPITDSAHQQILCFHSLKIQQHSNTRNNHLLTEARRQRRELDDRYALVSGTQGQHAKTRSRVLLRLVSGNL